MPPAESKAAAIISVLATLRETLTPAQLDAFLRALPPDTRALVEKPPLASTWILSDHFFAILDTLHEGVYGRDLARTTELARAAMLNDLSTIYRVFIRLSSPGFVLARGAKIYTTYTRNNGELAVPEVGDHFARITLRGNARCTPTVWAYNTGAILATMQATGVKEPKVEIVSGGKDLPECEWRVTWK